MVTNKNNNGIPKTEVHTLKQRKMKSVDVIAGDVLLKPNRANTTIVGG